MYAGNLSWSVTKDDLLDYMQQAGDVVSAEVMHHPDGRSKVRPALMAAIARWQPDERSPSVAVRTASRR